MAGAGNILASIAAGEQAGSAGLDPTGALWIIGQTSPGGDWGAWEELGPPG